MNTRLVVFLTILAAVAAVPAVAQSDLYDNGPTNGTTDAWTINFGFIVSDTFTLGAATSPTGITFAAWLFPGDVLESAEVSITSSEFGGTTYFDEVVQFDQSGCVLNQFGFNVCREDGWFRTQPNLNAGTYWLNLQNAVVNTGDPVYWDENGGPSQASDNSVGTIPSESFSINGGCGGSKSSPDCGPPPPPTSPEPSSLLLFGSGAAAMLGVARRFIR
jgi:PEP-CTERM motif-containing protein